MNRNPTGKGGFVKGQSGNPGGRTPVGQTFGGVLRDLLDQEKNGTTTRARIAATVVDMALKGNLAATQWISDKVEGKTPERLEATVDGSVSHAVADATVESVLARFAARRGPDGGEA